MYSSFLICRFFFFFLFFFFFSSRRRHTRSLCDWSSDVCSSDLMSELMAEGDGQAGRRMVGQQHDRARLGKRGPLAPPGQPPSGERVERGARGSENDADGAIG